MGALAIPKPEVPDTRHERVWSTRRRVPHSSLILVLEARGDEDGLFQELGLRAAYRLRRATQAVLGLLDTPPVHELDRLSLEPPPPPPHSESSPRRREIMAPGRSPARPPWTAPADPSHRLPGGVDQDDLPAFYH